jgi:hypothetical protein
MADALGLQYPAAGRVTQSTCIFQPKPASRFLERQIAFHTNRLTALQSFSRYDEPLF